MTEKVQALLIHGGRISQETAKQIIEWFDKYAPENPAEDVLLVEMPPGVRFKFVEFDPDAVVDTLEVIEDPNRGVAPGAPTHDAEGQELTPGFRRTHFPDECPQCHVRGGEHKMDCSYRPGRGLTLPVKGWPHWGDDPCAYCGESRPEGDTDPWYRYECPTCLRDGCPDCMPGGRGCECPDCEEKGGDDA